MKKNHLILALLLMNSATSYSQVENGNEKEKGASPITEVYVIYGGANGSGEVLTLRDFRKMAPSSQFLNEDLSSYNSYASSELFAHNFYGMMVGLIPGKKNRVDKKYSPLLRLGLNYESADYFDNYLSKSNSFRFDTLYNSQGQAVYYRDSVNYSSADMIYSSSSLSAEVSILLRTNTSKRWMFYLGIGISGGISFKNEITVFKTESKFVDEYEVDGSSTGHLPYFYNFDSFQSETINVGSSWVVSGFVPLGVDFRLGRKNEFLKQVHLLAEFRPGIKMMGIPKIGVNTGTYSLANVGIRYVWN